MAGFLASWSTQRVGGSPAEQSRGSWPWWGRRLVWASLTGMAIAGLVPAIATATQPIPFGAPLPDSGATRDPSRDADGAAEARESTAAVAPPPQARSPLGVANPGPRPDPDFFAPIDRPSPSYGVYVLGDNLATFDQVRHISDSATFTTYRGQTAITAGRFAQLFEARARVQELARLGLRAEIAPQPSSPESQPARSASSRPPRRSLVASTAPPSPASPLLRRPIANRPTPDPAAVPTRPAPESPALLPASSTPEDWGSESPALAPTPDRPASPTPNPSAASLGPDPTVAVGLRSNFAEIPPSPNSATASGWELPLAGSGATLVPPDSPATLPVSAPANVAPTLPSQIAPRPAEPELVAQPAVALRSNRATAQPYFLVIPGSPDELLKLVDRLLAAGVAATNITATAEEFGPQLRIGPFADLTLASQWRDSLGRSRIRAAIYQNGWLLDTP